MPEKQPFDRTNMLFGEVGGQAPGYATSFVAMFITQVLRQQLLDLGFTPLGNACYVAENSLQVCLLDGARLRLDSPQGGMRYVAVLSAQHLVQEVADFQTQLAPLQV